MRTQDKPLPGDLVIRRRQDGEGLRRRDVYVLTHWPDAETVIAGPYQSVGYALSQARDRLNDPSVYIWRDHARRDEPEQLEDVTPDDEAPRGGGGLFGSRQNPL